MVPFCKYSIAENARSQQLYYPFYTNLTTEKTMGTSRGIALGDLLRIFHGTREIFDMSFIKILNMFIATFTRPVSVSVEQRNHQHRKGWSKYYMKRRPSPFMFGWATRLDIGHENTANSTPYIAKGYNNSLNYSLTWPKHRNAFTILPRTSTVIK